MESKKFKNESILKSLGYVFRKLYSLIKDFRRGFFIGFTLILLIELLRLAEQYLFKDLVDLVTRIEELNSALSLVYIIAVIAALYLVISLFQYVAGLLTVKTQINVGHYLSLVVFRKHLDLSLRYHEKENTGAKLNKIQNGIESVDRIISFLMWDCAPVLFRCVSSFIFLLFIDYRMGLVFFGAIPFFVLTTIRMNRRAQPLRRGIRTGYERVYGGFGQAIYNIKTVKAFVQEDREKRRAKTGIVEIIKKQFQFVSIVFSVNFIRNLIIALGNIAVMGFGALLAYRGEISTGELVLFISVSGSTYYFLYGLTRVFDNIMDAKVGVERMFGVLDSQDEIVASATAIKLDLIGEIEFRNVSFDYGEGDVLKNINLKIKPGEIVALVGPSGGGKSTIAKLLYRYYDVGRGSILIDGKNITDLEVKHYRSQLGIVNQDIDIFNDTIRANIAYGNPHAKFEDIKKAAEIANAQEFIEKFDRKYETVVGERGVKLSGGQRQRVGIARAVLINPRIFILDEATSSLDASSELMIQQAIARVIKNRTTIIIAHRLSTIKNADRIVVIDNGQIVEQGSHQELLSRQGMYKKLVELQVGGYLE